MTPRFLIKPGRFFLTLLLLVPSFTVLPAVYAAGPADQDEAPGRTLARQAVKSSGRWTTVDHSKTAQLKQDFLSGEQITNACLSCHSEAADQFHQSIHWTWLASGSKKDLRYGKAGHSVNNFCISANAMQDKSCLSCHPAWNKKGTKGEVNCLVCHNSSGFNFEEAMTDIQGFATDMEDPEIKEIVADIQNEVKDALVQISLPSRKSCGDCHFLGGGGDGVKHGDLDTSLTNPNRELDVHMGVDGKNFSCTRCHTTVEHHIAGRIYTNPAVETRKSLIEDDMAPKITCVSCHSAEPHKRDAKMNDHTDVVSCQACHIPEFARVNPTKTWWDWSKAGKKKNGKAYVEKGAFGKPVYKTIKGEFKWEKNVVPEYFWFNGSIKSTILDQMIDPARTVRVSHPMGERSDPESRIYPFKIHRGVQPYDKINKKLVAPLLSGNKGFWGTLDMNDAISLGQQTMELTYSGRFDYVSTSFAYPITHMVAPKEKALACIQCHTRENSRLAGIAGIYLPGKDRTGLLDTIGWLSVMGALAGVSLHGLGRIFSRNGRKQSPGEL